MLKGVRVLQFEGLAPTVFCGMYFADQGAEVILVGRKDPAPMSMAVNQNLMNRGKKWVILSVKAKVQKRIIEELIKTSDIIIDPYRPGVLEKLNLGPEFIFRVNPKAILLRVSGYGQTGQMSLRPGHDLNYISSSGIVPLINSNNDSKISEFPTNYLADFVSCSLGLTATLSALSIAKLTGKGRIVDCSMTDGCRYYTKIIDQVSGERKPKVSVLQPQFRTHNGTSYLILAESMNQKEWQKGMERMARQGNEELTTSQFRITKVKEIPALGTQVNGLLNPFDNSGKPDKQLPEQSLSSESLVKLMEMRRSRL